MFRGIHTIHACAEHYLNQLDPLHPETRDPDFIHERAFEFGADDRRWHEERQRLSGHVRERASKLISTQTLASPSAAR